MPSIVSRLDVFIDRQVYPLSGRHISGIQWNQPAHPSVTFILGDYRSSERRLSYWTPRSVHPGSLSDSEATTCARISQVTDNTLGSRRSIFQIRWDRQLLPVSHLQHLGFENRRPDQSSMSITLIVATSAPPYFNGHLSCAGT